MLCQNSAHPNGYFFGTQNLRCVTGSGRKSRSVPPTRFGLALSHRLVYYRNAVYELHPSGVHTRNSPNWEAARRCPVTWEASPAGTSTCSSQALTIYTNRYINIYDRYNVLTNNCHDFANRLSAYIFNSNCESSIRPR